jgi:glutamine synthetase
VSSVSRSSSCQAHRNAAEAAYDLGTLDHRTIQGGAVGFADGRLTLDKLRYLVEKDAVDTVLVAMTDMQGRLQGKRCSAEFFLDDVIKHGTDTCDYLLAVDVDMRTVDGYRMSSWDQGYGDMALRPDLSTLRLVPWHESTAMVLADVEFVRGGPVPMSPRQLLLAQLDRLADRGLLAYVGTELEFLLFEDSYEQAWQGGYRELTPSNLYNIDYSLLGTGRVESVLRDIRNKMSAAGMYVESAKGECNPGQHEIAFRYTDALTTCDNHSIYKTGAKEIAAAHGKSLTFMAKYDEREGNSCHIHISVRDRDGNPVMAGDREYEFSPLMENFIAGQLACLREFTYFFAPNINSYKRFAPGSFAPTAIAWGEDNRTCALRVVGKGQSLRMENRVPGGDVNPYLAVAALIAAGLHGIDRELPLEPAFTGNAYTSGRPTVPRTLREDAFDSTITDWERFRSFERM